MQAPSRRGEPEKRDTHEIESHHEAGKRREQAERQGYPTNDQDQAQQPGVGREIGQAGYIRDAPRNGAETYRHTQEQKP